MITLVNVCNASYPYTMKAEKVWNTLYVIPTCQMIENSNNPRLSLFRSEPQKINWT